MSEIPFVNRLGDALDEAIATPQRAKARRPRRRRFGGLAVAVFLLGAGGVTVAEILDDPERLATAEVACYSEATLEPGLVSVQSGEGRSPTAVCADVLRTDAALVACARKEGFVSVFPGPPDTCERLGLKPLPAGYDDARRKVARLRANVDRVVRSADCIPPEVLARRLQRVLDESGWRGWRAVVDRGEGPCGWLGIPVGMRADRRELGISGGPPRSLERILSGAGVALVPASGERCYDVAGLRRLTRRRLAPTRRRIVVTVDAGPLPQYEQMEPPARQQRFDEGCAVVDEVYADYPKPGRIVVRVKIRVKRA